MTEKVRANDYEFDIAEYLDAKGLHYTTVGKNLMLCCPFHEETHPSFGIHVTTGKYNCFSGSCKAHGTLPGFIQKMEGLPSIEAAEAWLRGGYGLNTDSFNQPIQLNFGDEGKKQEKIVFIPDDILAQWDFRHPYLVGRGISDLWQRRFRIGFDREAGAVTMPWFDRLGRCVGIKFRSVVDKFFWVYHQSSVGPNKITLFGINHVFRRKEKSVIVTESEIDALYLWAMGYPAVALGTSHMTQAQLKEFKNCPVEEVIIATDNDAAGLRIRDNLVKELFWIPNIKVVDWTLFPGVKDVNELNRDQIELLVSTSVCSTATLLSCS